MEPVDGVAVSGDWLSLTQLQELFNILLADGGEALVAGGAVRNALMGLPVADTDLSTTLVPDVVVKRLEAAGHKAVPTGIEHGTVTAVIDGHAFEVTTLREDIETNGRHAVVRFGTDWQADAERRDLTINALYCDRDGRIFDPVGGLADVSGGVVRFIGNPVDRILEDGLRILRFFRFFAWYGHGRPDAAGLKACSANRAMLSNLSAERVWSELRKLLAARDPGRALLWMRTTGILGLILPETEKWGIDTIPGLIELEQKQGWKADYLLRLMAMVRPEEENVAGLGERLLLSNADRERLKLWSQSSVPPTGATNGELEKQLYRGSASGIMDAMRLEIVHLRNRDDETGAGAMRGLLEHAATWERPEFPVSGKDLIAEGMSPGPAIGKRMAALEERWIESGFQLSRASLLEL